jgi:hypothetical protein
MTVTRRKRNGTRIWRNMEASLFCSMHPLIIVTPKSQKSGAACGYRAEADPHAQGAATIEAEFLAR